MAQIEAMQSPVYSEVDYYEKVSTSNLRKSLTFIECL